MKPAFFMVGMTGLTSFHSAASSSFGIASPAYSRLPLLLVKPAFSPVRNLTFHNYKNIRDLTSRPLIFSWSG